MSGEKMDIKMISIPMDEYKKLEALRAENAELRKAHIPPSQIEAELAAKDIFDGDPESKRLYIFRLKELTKKQSQQIGELVEALKKISGMERMTFAECTDAEFIMDTANEAIRSVEQGK